jgi:hypothetical protein
VEQVVYVVLSVYFCHSIVMCTMPFRDKNLQELTLVNVNLVALLQT